MVNKNCKFIIIQKNAYFMNNVVNIAKKYRVVFGNYYSKIHKKYY